MVLRVPPIRVVHQNDHPIRHDGDFVVYWMIAQRRTSHSFALDRACEHAVELGKPLVYTESEKVFDPKDVYGDAPNPTKL